MYWEKKYSKTEGSSLLIHTHTKKSKNPSPKTNTFTLKNVKGKQNL